MTLTPASTSRRSMLAGAFGLGALGGVALSGSAADAALGDPVIPSAPETTFLLSVPGVPGSSTVERFEGQIDVLTFAWGVDTPVVIGGGGGSGVGRPTARPFVFAAPSGIQSPKLALAANTGRRAATAVLSCVRLGEAPFTYMTLGFTDVAVSSYAVTPAPDDGTPYDLVSVAYRRVTQTVFTQKPDGSAGTPVTMTYDYATNRGA